MGTLTAEECSFLDADNEEEAMREAQWLSENMWPGYGKGSLKFYDKKFDNEDDAFDFFYSIGRDGIVMVKEATKASQKRCNERVNRYNKKIAQLNARRLEEFKKRKSKTVGCKKCGNRVDNETALRHGLYCPSCGEPFGGEGYKKRLQDYKDKIEESYARLRKDTSENGEYRYWFKVSIYEIYS